MWSYLKSRTFWTIVAMFVISGGTAIIPNLPAAIQPILTGFLGILAIYYHTNPSQQYNTGSINR